MKTVGIITTFRQPNFGSVLQAFALQKVIDRMGYKSLVIDYKYPNDYHYEHGNLKRPCPVTWRHPYKMFLYSILEYLGLKTIPKMKLLNQFISNEMMCTLRYMSYKEIHELSPKFDIYISGSDQIWNPNTMYGDMTYFYDFAPDNSKIISYSSSFSCDSIPEKYKDQYKKYLSRYSAISVRESNGCKLVKELIGRDDSQLVLDPTLLLDKDEWMQYAKKSRRLKVPKKYILCYMLAYTYDPNEKMKELLKFVQRKYQLPIVSLSPIKGWDGDEFIRIERHQSIGNYEFLRLFANAEMVVTSSFHGTAFSINFGKPFLALQNGKSKSDDRISSLLDMIGLQSQLVTTSTSLDNEKSPFYDVNSIRNALNEKRMISLKYLQLSMS